MSMPPGRRFYSYGAPGGIDFHQSDRAAVGTKTLAELTCRSQRPKLAIKEHRP